MTTSTISPSQLQSHHHRTTTTIDNEPSNDDDHPSIESDTKPAHSSSTGSTTAIEHPSLDPPPPPPPPPPSSSSSSSSPSLVSLINHHPLNILPPSLHSFNQHAHSIASLIREKRKQIAHSSVLPTPSSARSLPPPLQLTTHLSKLHPSSASASASLSLSPSHAHQSLPSSPSTSALNLAAAFDPHKSLVSASTDHPPRRSGTRSATRTRTNTRIISHNLSDLIMTNSRFDTLQSNPSSSSSSPAQHHLNQIPSHQTQRNKLPPSFIDLLPKAYHSLNALDPALGEVVMTPTTEEWWAFGGISHQAPKFPIKPSILDDSSTQASTNQIEHHVQADQIDQEDVEEADDDSDHTGASSNPSSSATQSPKPEPSSSITTPDNLLETCIDRPSSPPTSRLTPLNLCSASSFSIPANTLPNSPSSLVPPLQLSSTLEPSAGLISTEAEPSLALTSVNGIINVPSNSLAHPQAIQTAPSSPPPILTALSSNSFGSAEYPNASLTSTALLSSFLDKVPPSTGARPCCLAHDGIVRKPIDPRSYSAITHHRNLESFVVHSTAGSGAYGIVKHAQEKGADGQPVGPPLVIKYIIKQRILADCWKRHKVLGPIPIEIHVLDHIRRVNSRPSVISMARRYNNMRRTRGQIGPIRTIPNRTELHETYIREEEEQIERAQDSSAQQQQRTGHPNICGILDYFEDADYYYLVMPRFGDGKDLFEHIEMSPDGLPIEEVRRIFGQIVDAVAYLHERNIVHRDLKDENVILDRDGNAQLIDFGSAAYVREDSKFETFSGTLDFAAPEVLKGIPHSGKEIDVWALGVILYVLITGECPFWTPEEAAKGIQEGSRARQTLEERLNGTRTAPAAAQGAVADTGDHQLNPAHEDDAQEDYHRSILDLLLNCLQLEPRSRPSVELICWHRFFHPQAGWSTIDSKEFPNFSDSLLL